MAPDTGSTPLARRDFLVKSARMTLLGISAPTLLAACATGETGDAGDAVGVAEPGSSPTAAGLEGRAVVDDVIDFALTSEEWAGDFGWVDLRLHSGLVDGSDVYFIRTDTSDPDLSSSDGLVLAPKLANLGKKKLSGEIFLFEDDQPAVLSTEPGKKDYTPAWRINRVSWRGEPRPLGSVDEVRAAEESGDIDVEGSDTVLNAAVVKWSGGEMPVDGSLEEYLGDGQLIEAPDTGALSVRFKLHECFPGVRYIVTDSSLEPMAEGMNIVHSPRLAGSSAADATGRTNVFMNGLDGPGPMGFQPSVFDSVAGAAEWSPYWDHMTYAWADGATAQLLDSEGSIHERRDAGELEEFPGTPETNGDIFTVNCQVPVLAPNTFTG